MTKFTFKGKNFRLEAFNMYKEKYKHTHMNTKQLVGCNKIFYKQIKEKEINK